MHVEVVMFGRVGGVLAPVLWSAACCEHERQSHTRNLHRSDSVIEQSSRAQMCVTRHSSRSGPTWGDFGSVERTVLRQEPGEACLLVRSGVVAEGCGCACRSGGGGESVSQQAEIIRGMTADLGELRRRHRDILGGLEGAHDAPTDPEARAHIDAARHAQRMWEDRMSDLLAAVSRLQGPPSKVSLSGRHTTGGAGVA